MSYLNSEALLDLLVRERLLTSEQRQSIILNKGKQRLKAPETPRPPPGRRIPAGQGVSRPGRHHPLSDLETAGKPPQPISEEMIMLAVSRASTSRSRSSTRWIWT
jgi:hypothetical protein